MSKHTPGPWTYYPEDNIIVSKSGYRLLDWIARSTAVSIDERNANARLIAAAPELLEALQSVHKIIIEGSLEGFNPLIGDWAKRLYESQYNTSIAIKKATGE